MSPAQHLEPASPQPNAPNQGATGPSLAIAPFGGEKNSMGDVKVLGMRPAPPKQPSPKPSILVYGVRGGEPPNSGEENVAPMALVIVLSGST